MAQHCCTGDAHLSVGSNFLCDIKVVAASLPNSKVDSVNHEYSMNNPVKFHPNPIWNDGGIGFFEDSYLNKKNNKTSKNT